jgi:hypothetical protein
MNKNQKGFSPVEGLLILVIVGLIGFVGWFVWHSKNNTNSTNMKATTNTVTTSKTNSKVQTKTCNDKETVATGYKLFRSDTYKYCIQYPTDWPVNQTKADMVTYGAFNPEPTATWFRVTYFSGKSVTTRTNELKADYVEPNGPCVVSDAKVSDWTGKKLACTGSFNNEIHVYYLIAEDSNLFELSYIEGMGADQAPADVIYKVMLNSFLCDMDANK